MGRKPREVTEAPAGVVRRSLVQVDLSLVQDYLTPASWSKLEAEVVRMGAKLEELRRCLPPLEQAFQVRETDLTHWRELADELRANSDIILVLGGGGCQLAGRMLVEAFRSPLQRDRCEVMFTGDHLHPDRYGELLTALAEQQRRVSLLVISQGPAPLEISLGLRLLGNFVARRHGGAEALRRIVFICDSDSEVLVTLAQNGGYRRLALPDRCGSQFLAMSAAALFPAACAGLDVTQFVEGVRSQARSMDRQTPADDPCYQFCLARQILLSEHQLGELLLLEEPSLNALGQWWRHLMGPTSATLGLAPPFPATAGLISDLYTLGCLYQHLPRANLFEIGVRVQQFRLDPALTEGDDEPKPVLSEIYREVRQALADSRSQLLPGISLSIDRHDLFSIGALVGFFETVAAISHRLLGLQYWSDGAVALFEGQPG